ncbi:Dolichyl-diphosphooligosaccharide--protein glycosyltransferase subunit 2 [Sarcoptes scabiei]|uniref:Dolichyl-diphosphooligosaccharide--protein glycosyltransferase subunit 2 n=1 Tax=Sarcoptes scabiei TaxID=52283 RepID=A0A834R8T6_SARSC|nr:Dolichyl-diphosphooligosaccharide--protein glycosyltransferase subunit 2 [Sarcoptes scabiei]
MKIILQESIIETLIIVTVLSQCVLASSDPSSTLISSLDRNDIERLKNVVALKTPLSENPLSNLYYHAHLNFVLNQKLQDSQRFCEHIKKVPDSDLSLENVYFITLLSKLLSCSIDSVKFQNKVQALVNNNLSMIDLYRIGSVLHNLGKPMDSSKLSKLLLDALKREESLLNTGLAFQLASRFTKLNDRNLFVERIPDVIVQADEINNRFLQFEGGLGVTAAIIRGIYDLSAAHNKAIDINTDQAIKFVNYFLSRKHVLTPKGANDVVDILQMYTDNKYHIPYIITKFGSSSLSRNNPVLTLKITNVLGNSIDSVSVSGTSVTNDKAQVVMNEIRFKSVTGDSTLFAFDFFEKPLPSGFFTLTVNALPSKPNTKIIGNTNVKMGFAIQTQIKISDAELIVTYHDSGVQNFPLLYPKEIFDLPEIGYLDRLQLKFKLHTDLNSDAKKNLIVHQAFIRFHHTTTNQEIIFIAEIDSNDHYKIDLNLQTRSKEFNDLSGIYQVDLIVGDALLMEPLKWTIGKIPMKLGSISTSLEDVAVVAKEYQPKPEINHIFREQEKRPHALVSNFFTFLVLVPLITLFIAWVKIGVNLSNYRFNLSSILFHSSLAAIFLLYGCFFVSLNMFQTIKYLTGLSVIVYLSGHSLLSNLIRKKL